MVLSSDAQRTVPFCPDCAVSRRPEGEVLPSAVPALLDSISLPSEHFLLHLDVQKKFKDSSETWKTNNVCKCAFCSRAKQRRERADTVKPHEHMRPEPTCFGHLQSDWFDFGPALKVIGGMRYSLLVRDRFTKALGCYASQTRKAEHVVKLYKRFSSRREVLIPFTDGGRELSRANELLGWERPTSPPYRPQANPAMSSLSRTA